MKIKKLVSAVLAVGAVMMGGVAFASMDATIACGETQSVLGLWSFTEQTDGWVVEGADYAMSRRDLSLKPTRAGVDLFLRLGTYQTIATHELTVTMKVKMNFSPRGEGEAAPQGVFFYTHEAEEFMEVEGSRCKYFDLTSSEGWQIVKVTVDAGGFNLSGIRIDVRNAVAADEIIFDYVALTPTLADSSSFTIDYADDVYEQGKLPENPYLYSFNGNQDFLPEGAISSAENQEDFVRYKGIVGNASWCRNFAIPTDNVDFITMRVRNKTAITSAWLYMVINGNKEFYKQDLVLTANSDEWQTLVVPYCYFKSVDAAYKGTITHAKLLLVGSDTNTDNYFDIDYISFGGSTNNIWGTDNIPGEADDTDYCIAYDILGDVTILEGGELPQATLAKYSNGTEEWVNFSYSGDYDLNAAGTYTVTASISPKFGYIGGNSSSTFALTVTEKVKVVSIEELQTITVDVNGKAELPETVAVNLLDGGSAEGAITWENTEIDTSVGGEYTLKGKVTVENYEFADGVSDEIELIVRVVKKVVSTGEISDKTVEFGEEHGLPTEVEVTFDDGTKGVGTIEWSGEYNKQEAGRYAMTGIISVDGYEFASDEENTLSVFVTVKELVKCITAVENFETTYRVKKGESFALPTEISVTVTGDAKKTASISWDKEADTSNAGEFTYAGKISLEGYVFADGVSDSVTVRVIVAEGQEQSSGGNTGCGSSFGIGGAILGAIGIAVFSARRKHGDEK